MGRFIIDDKINLDNDKIDTYEISTIVDTETKNFYFIVDSLANIESFIERLNQLNNEKEQLKSATLSLQMLCDDLTKTIAEKHKENEKLKNMCENLVNADNRREFRLRQRIEELEKELNHLNYRFTEYRNKGK